MSYGSECDPPGHQCPRSVAVAERDLFLEP